eukprot:Lankesteria_metandrocarpae@DN4291_c0_g1_i1.p1
MLEFEKNCTVLLRSELSSPASVTDLQKRLESPQLGVKAKALEDTIFWTIQGEAYSKLLMSVIRFAVPSHEHRIKKLLLLYWEVVDKCKPDGTNLRDEMILVCNGLLQDLVHSNEYVRGSTLRLLCKIRYLKIIEPLTGAIMANLTHRNSYVRRNAVMCVHSIVNKFGVDFIPNATEEVEKVLNTENDVSTKRNAFLMLSHCDFMRAFKYLLRWQVAVGAMGDIFQLSALELVRRVYRKQPDQRGVCLRIVVHLVQHCPPTVAYEGASTLVTLTNSPVALKAATQAYVSLLTNQADNNVRLIVLDRLANMMPKHSHILEGFIMDIMRGLRCQSLVVRKRTLDIAHQLLTNSSVHDVVPVLRKEIVKSMELEQQSSESAVEYRRLLIRTVHAASSKFPGVSHSVMQLLLDFMTEHDSTTTTEVVFFVRGLVALYPQLRPSVLQRVAESLSEVQHSRVLRVCLWVLGEYSETPELAKTSVNAIYDALRPLPILADQSQMDSGRRTGAAPHGGGTTDDSGGRRTLPTGGDASGPKVKITTRTVVLEDGTYGTEDVFEAVDDSTGAGASAKDEKRSPMRNLISGGDSLLASVVCVSLTKLVLRHFADAPASPQAVPQANAYRVKSAFIVATLLKFIRDARSQTPVVEALATAPSDALYRIGHCLRTLLHVMKSTPAELSKLRSVWFSSVRESLSRVLEVEREAALYENSTVGFFEVAPEGDESTAADELLSFRQLRSRRGAVEDTFDDAEADVRTAVGSGLGGGSDDGELFQQRLAKVQQMTGLADPVYVEAFIQVHHFDLLVELLVINRTNDTLQNVNVELSTHGDLKLVDRPPALTLAPEQSVTVNASIKVQSTETGVIFGYVTYDKKSAADKECLVLNELHMDLLDYIQRSWMGELSFRSMWSEFEWENKINVNTTIADVGQFLEHIMKNTNMTVVGKYAKSKKASTTQVIATSNTEAKDEYLESIHEMPVLKNLMNESHFFAVNLYSRSIFGEDALANVSIEKLPDGKLAGCVRIRSRTQGIALSLGDRITVLQRESVNFPVAFA